MTYKDMTFCTFYENCANSKGCHRKLTPTVRAQAELWWGGPGAPISMWLRLPKCHVKRDKSVDD